MITYNGNEFVLQNDMGNAKVERAKLSPGFLPMGMKEYGGIVYIASYNPDTLECEIGSFPSPERDITGSTDIENQTGLVDGNFNNVDYVKSITKSITEFTPEEILSKLQKLNEEEVLRLNPGDKFITSYEIEPGSGSGVPVTNTNFNDIFSLDDDSKKIFHINFYKIDSSNEIVKLDPLEVGSILYRPDIEEDELKYYTQTSAGSIAVEVLMNDLIYFNTSVRELSKLTEESKKLRIQATGVTDSLIEFKGMRVDVAITSEDNSTSQSTFHVENTGIGEDISVTLDQLIKNDNVTMEITPYSQYGYSPKLTKVLNYKVGAGVGGDSITDIFKWNVVELNNRNRLELDFDFKLQTDSQLNLYLEFYDPWSNVSMIRNINSPSIYGSMRLVLPLVDEKRSLLFDNYPLSPVSQDATKKLGGIPFNNLMINTDTQLKANLVNPSTYGATLVRSDGSLRKNHFYIVRICGYEVDSEDNYTYHEVYKALYTSTIYNDLYAEQEALSIDDPNTITDFTKVPYPLSKIGYSAKILSGNSPILLTNTGLQQDPAAINTTISGESESYPFSPDQRPSTSKTHLTSKVKHTAVKNYSIGISKPDHYIYGNLTDDVLLVTGQDSDIEVVDSNIGTEDLKMNSVAELELDTIDTTAASFNVKLIVDTYRGVEGKIKTDVITGAIEKVFLNKLLYEKDNSQTTTFECSGVKFKAPLSLYRVGVGGNRRNPCSNLTKSGTILLMIKNNITGTEQLVAEVDGRDRSSINSISYLNTSPLSNFQFYSVFNFNGYLKTPNADAVTANTQRLMFVQRNGGNRIIQFPISNWTNLNLNTQANEFLSKFYYYKSGANTSYEGYYLEAITPSNNNTLLNYVNLTVNSTWDTTLGKIYTFQSLFKGLGNTVTPFNISSVNQIIQASIAKTIDVNVISGELDDNRFVPYIDNTVSIPVVTTVLNLEPNSLIILIDPPTNEVNRFQLSYEKYLLEKGNLTTIQTTAILTTSTGINGDTEKFMKSLRYDATSDCLVPTGFLSTTSQYYFNYSGSSREIGSVPTLSSSLNLQV